MATARSLLETLGASFVEESVAKIPFDVLELESLFPENEPGDVEITVFSPEAFGFTAPPELAAIGPLWIAGLENVAQVKTAVRDAHARLRVALDVNGKKLIALGFEPAVKSPTPYARGTGVVAGHSLVVTVENGRLNLVRADGTPIPPESQEVHPNVDKADVDEVTKLLGGRIKALLDSGVIPKGKGLFSSNTVRAPFPSAKSDDDKPKSAENEVPARPESTKSRAVRPRRKSRLKSQSAEAIHDEPAIAPPDSPAADDDAPSVLDGRSLHSLGLDAADLDSSAEAPEADVAAAAATAPPASESISIASGEDAVVDATPEGSSARADEPSAQAELAAQGETPSDASGSVVADASVPPLSADDDVPEVEDAPEGGDADADAEAGDAPATPVEEAKAALDADALKSSAEDEPVAEKSSAADAPSSRRGRRAAFLAAKDLVSDTELVDLDLDGESQSDQIPAPPQADDRAEDIAVDGAPAASDADADADAAAAEDAGHLDDAKVESVSSNASSPAAAADVEASAEDSAFRDAGSQDFRDDDDGEGEGGEPAQTVVADSPNFDDDKSKAKAPGEKPDMAKIWAAAKSASELGADSLGDEVSGLLEVSRTSSVALDGPSLVERDGARQVAPDNADAAASDQATRPPRTSSSPHLIADLLAPGARMPPSSMSDEGQEDAFASDLSSEEELPSADERPAAEQDRAATPNEAQAEPNAIVNAPANDDDANDDDANADSFEDAPASRAPSAHDAKTRMVSVFPRGGDDDGGFGSDIATRAAASILPSASVRGQDPSVIPDAPTDAIPSVSELMLPDDDALERAAREAIDAASPSATGSLLDEDALVAAALAEVGEDDAPVHATKVRPTLTRGSSASSSAPGLSKSPRSPRAKDVDVAPNDVAPSDDVRKQNARDEHDADLNVDVAIDVEIDLSSAENSPSEFDVDDNAVAPSSPTGEIVGGFHGGFAEDDTELRPEREAAAASPPRGRPSFATPVKAPLVDSSPGAYENLASIVGEGLSTGKTGAIALDAAAFALLRGDANDEDARVREEAAALRRDAAEFEARAAELRDKADRLELTLRDKAAPKKPARSLADRVRQKRDPGAIAQLASDAVPLSALEAAISLPKEVESTMLAPVQNFASLDVKDDADDSVFGTSPAGAEAKPAADDGGFSASEVNATAIGGPSMLGADKPTAAPPMPQVPPAAAPDTVPVVAVVVSDERVKAPLAETLAPRLSQLSFHTDPREILGATVIVFVRPERNDSVAGLIAGFSTRTMAPKILVLSDDETWIGVEGVDHRVDLGARASEVVEQILTGLQDLGYTPG